MTDLGTFSATAMSEATAVNRGGDVVGGSGGHALLVHNGTMTDLGLGEATGIEDVGQIVGNSQGAFVISGGTRTTLPGLSSYGGGGFSSATGINNNHQIAEASGTACGYSHAVMWSNGTINDNGQEHAFLLTQLVSAPRIYRPPARLIHAGRSGRLRGARDYSHYLAERTDTGGGPP